MPLMLENDPELRALFEEETVQWMGMLKNALRRLYRFPGDHQALETAQRAAHTLKGNLRMVGLQQAADLAAQMNDALRTALHDKRALTANEVLRWARWADQLSRLLIPHGIPYIGEISVEDKV